MDASYGARDCAHDDDRSRALSRPGLWHLSDYSHRSRGAIEPEAVAERTDDEKVIARAEFLLKLQPSQPYDLIGHNCEIIANMCASGSWTESYQVRRGFGVRAYTSAATVLYIAWLGRRKLPLPSWLYAWVVIGSAVSIAARTTYNHGIKKLWDEIRDDWLAHEHKLEEDPRNG